jgi:hypothetical protein
MLLVADDLYSLPYRVGVKGLVPITIPASAAAPSVHAVELAREVAPAHQRLLAPSGTHRDAVVPAAWARVWQIPIAGGYGPMLLGRYAVLGQIGTNGAIDPHGLGTGPVTNRMAVGRIMIPAEDLTAADLPTVRAALEPAAAGTGIGRADCDKMAPTVGGVAHDEDVAESPSSVISVHGGGTGRRKALTAVPRRSDCRARGRLRGPGHADRSLVTLRSSPGPNTAPGLRRSR